MKFEFIQMKLLIMFFKGMFFTRRLILGLKANKTLKKVIFYITIRSTMLIFVKRKWIQFPGTKVVLLYNIFFLFLGLIDTSLSVMVFHHSSKETCGKWTNFTKNKSTVLSQSRTIYNRCSLSREIDRVIQINTKYMQMFNAKKFYM